VNSGDHWRAHVVRGRRSPAGSTARFRRVHCLVSRKESFGLSSLDDFHEEGSLEKYFPSLYSDLVTCRDRVAKAEHSRDTDWASGTDPEAAPCPLAISTEVDPGGCVDPKVAGSNKTAQSSTTIPMATWTGPVFEKDWQYFALLGQLDMEAKSRANVPVAASTSRAYKSDWSHFAAWCQKNEVTALPASPDTIALYIVSLAGSRQGEPTAKAATIKRRLASINATHRSAGIEPPATLRDSATSDAWRSVRQFIETEKAQKRPLTTKRIVAVLAALDGKVMAIRDKALLLVGFAGALGRSELAAIRVEHLEWNRRGLVIRIPGSETRKGREAKDVWIAHGVHAARCPVLALENWLKISGIVTGPVFRSIDAHQGIGESLSENSIGQIIKRMVGQSSLENVHEYAGHSLRAGFVTQAYTRGARLDSIMLQTGHKSVEAAYNNVRGSGEDDPDDDGAY